MSIDLAVIGGTGVYKLGELADVETHQPVTPYGAPSGPIRIGTCAGKRVAFLARHGEGHSLPPHRINYRANLAALKAVGATRVLAAIDARMGEVYWAEYQRDEQGVWHGEETEAVLKPEAVTGRLKQLSGEWATVGTGWAAWPEMAKDTGLTLVDGNMLLPAAEDMLPIACQLLAAGKTVAVEHAEPVYLRNTVAWKKLPGRE